MLTHRMFSFNMGLNLTSFLSARQIALRTTVVLRDFWCARCLKIARPSTKKTRSNPDLGRQVKTGYLTQKITKFRRLSHKPSANNRYTQRYASPIFLRTPSKTPKVTKSNLNSHFPNI